MQLGVSNRKVMSVDTVCCKDRMIIRTYHSVKFQLLI